MPIDSGRRSFFYSYPYGYVKTTLDYHPGQGVFSALMEITKTQRRWLASKAQRIKPTVMIGKEGLTDGVTGQTRTELEAHELIKVRFVGHKEFIQEIVPRLAGNTDSSLIRIIGHVAVLYRPRDDEEKRGIILPGE